MGVEWPGYPQVYLIPDVYVGGVIYLISVKDKKIPFLCHYMYSLIPNRCFQMFATPIELLVCDGREELQDVFYRRANGGVERSGLLVLACMVSEKFNVILICTPL